MCPVCKFIEVFQIHHVNELNSEWIQVKFPLEICFSNDKTCTNNKFDYPLS